MINKTSRENKRNTNRVRRNRAKLKGRLKGEGENTVIIYSLS
jgi:hypothetical protein